MSKSIVFFDIDGTIISEKTGLIPQSTKDAIKKLKENGHLAFINTGRPVSEITDTLRDLDFDGYVCGCGTYVEYKNEVLLYKSLGNKLSMEIVKYLKEYKLEGILEGRYGLYYDDINNIVHKDVLKIIDQHKHEGFFDKFHKNWTDENIDYDKFVIFLNEDSDFNSFFEKFKDTFDFIKRGEDFYELVPIGYSKASGIDFICNYLNISKENTYALGDSTNDLSMLEHVPNSIAMGNSTPVLFDKVSFITKDLEDDGIEYALKHYSLI